MLLMQRIVYMIAEHEKEEGAGMPRSEVVQTYLDGIEDQLGTIEQLEAETQLVEKVLNKLIKEKYSSSSAGRPSRPVAPPTERRRSPSMAKTSRKRRRTNPS
jgi:DNA replication licensing factor MCM6